VKPGVRALGIAESYATDRTESYTTDRSTLAGVVVRASRVVDGFVFGSCTVGGTDATDAMIDLWERLDRPDVRYLFVAGIAPAWFNIVDLHRLHDCVERPVLSVTFEDSEGLEPAIREAFDGEATIRRLGTYQAQPDRTKIGVEDGTVYVRSVGLGEQRVAEVVRAFTPAGERPEPVRVARQAARAADEFSA
jgi:endonuclease V-like protein UPF0215 family